ncbi:MAG: tRNA 2-thiouridine(34) synthase MnmA [Bacteriovoracia bacterium]
MDLKNKTVIVGMSGGVDSSVAALLLKEQGYNVIGMFMRNWVEEDDAGACTAEQDYHDVVAVCDKLEIPYYTVDFAKEYWENVFSNFLEEYKKGFTPNPDVLCNSEIKFKIFFEKAMELGADFLATGHYCRVMNSDKQYLLGKGVDQGKDQSYFLHAIDANVLDRVLFPVGELQKSKVRELAQKNDLSTKAKKDSTGICFIGERKFREFLANYVQSKPGNIETLDGKVIGKHQGVAFYTLGQRKGLGIGGLADVGGEGPWFVVGKDIKRNVLLAGRGVKHPALYCDYLKASQLNWINVDVMDRLPLKCKARVRYRQSDQVCQIIKEADDIKVVFDIPQRAVTPGQAVVFYDGDICLGGGVITEHGPTYFEQQKKLPDIVSG